MSQSLGKIERRLGSARRDRSPVTIRRFDRCDADLDGYVIGLSTSWLVVHRLIEHVHLDDVVAVRLDQVKKVAPHPHAAYVTRAVGGLGTPVASFEIGPDASAVDVLEIVSTRAELVALRYLHDEFRWGECGVIRSIGSPKFEFHQIAADGIWAEDSGLRRLDHLTSIEFGGLLLTALDRFKDDDPMA